METDALIIACHPDDAELGMGGTIASLCAAGKRVALIDLSDGEPTPHGSPEIRAEESKRASALLGVKERRILGLKNREIRDDLESRKLLAGAIRELKPKLIFAHYWEDAHPDHVAGSALTDAARFYSKFVKCDLPHEPHYPAKIIYFFSIHIRLGVRPSFVYDTSDHHARKMEAISAYRSQFQQNEKNRAVLAGLETEAAYWGRQIGTRYGEPFLLREDVRISSSDGLLGI